MGFMLAEFRLGTRSKKAFGLGIATKCISQITNVLSRFKYDKKEPASILSLNLS